MNLENTQHLKESLQKIFKKYPKNTVARIELEKHFAPRTLEDYIFLLEDDIMQKNRNGEVIEEPPQAYIKASTYSSGTGYQSSFDGIYFDKAVKAFITKPKNIPVPQDDGGPF